MLENRRMQLTANFTSVFSDLLLIDVYNVEDFIIIIIL